MTGDQNNSISEGTKFSKFTNKNSRIKTIHAMCAANNKYCINNGYAEGKAWQYWQSSALPSSSSSSRCMRSDGRPDYTGMAYYDFYGLAPCIRIPR